MPTIEDFSERLTRLETQLSERYMNTEERYRIAEERYRITERRYQILEERHRINLANVTSLAARLSSIENLILGLPHANSREHLLHVGAASIGGGGIMAGAIELIKILTT